MKAMPKSMAGSALLSGVFVVLQTPFHESLQVDESSFRNEVRFLVRCGVHGMVWPAAASEIASLGPRERIHLAEVLIEEVDGRTPVVIGVTAHNKFEAAEYAAHAQVTGANAILTLPQMDMQSSDPAMFIEYVCAITSVCDLPLFVQTSYPGHGSALPPDFLRGLTKKFPTFRYVKEEQVGFGPLPWRVSAYTCTDGLLIPMAGAGARNLMNEMARGSGGTMPGAGFADIQVHIWDCFHNGRTTEARDLFSKMLMMAVLEQSTGYVLQKEILRRRGVFASAVMRHSRGPLMDRGDMEELDAIFEVLRPHLRA